MNRHSELDYVLEVIFGRFDNMSDAWIYFAAPFAIAFALSRMALYLWMKKSGVRAPGFSPLVVSSMCALILTATFYSFFFFLLVLLFAPILFGLTPLLLMYLDGAARQQKLASPALVFGAHVRVPDLTDPMA
jgi:hypothetical protein